jgi:hypothetical protein
MSLLARLTVHDSAEQSFVASTLTPVGLAIDGVPAETPRLWDAGRHEWTTVFDDRDELVPFDMEPPAQYVQAGPSWLSTAPIINLTPVDRNERCSADEIARTSAFGWLDVPSAVLERLGASLLRAGGLPVDVSQPAVLSTASWDFAGEARELLRGSFAAPKLAGVLCRCERHYVPPTCPYL